MSGGEVTRTYSVIGLPVSAVDYATAVAECQRLARLPRATRVAASNTHIAVMAHEEADFGETMRRFDLIVPDGMPLVWMMNAQGAGLRDRVYGPYLMREVIAASGRPWRHYFLGGTEECLERLQVALREIQPELEVAGAFSPPFAPLEEMDCEGMVARLEEARADFIWVAFGGGKQERLIERLAAASTRGCFLAVGDAFPLLAGMREFAPGWVQRLGLTWLWRVAQEPRRLLGRYLHCNGRFVALAVAEWWRGLRKGRVDA